MSLNYTELALKYKPNIINTLLIGEAPPPNGKKYFYKVPDKCSSRKDIVKDTSLPATIFNHYFHKRPSTPNEYEYFLEVLKGNGIFLIDLYEEPETFRGKKENYALLFSEQNIQALRHRVKNLIHKKTEVIFLMPRIYPVCGIDKLKQTIPYMQFIRWIDFRMNTQFTTLF